LSRKLRAMTRLSHALVSHCPAAYRAMTRKPVRVCEFESYMPSHAVVSPTGGPMRLRARRLVRKEGNAGAFWCLSTIPAPPGTRCARPPGHRYLWRSLGEQFYTDAGRSTSASFANQVAILKVAPCRNTSGANGGCHARLATLPR
jgi:hypothetical protein